MQSKWNNYLQEKITLDEGEDFCPKCEGMGAKTEIGFYPCHKCLGKGKLDWIEKIMGVKPLKDFDHLMSQWTNKAAKDLAIKIDNEILDSILKGEKERKIDNVLYCWDS